MVLNYLPQVVCHPLNPAELFCWMDVTEALSGGTEVSEL